MLILCGTALEVVNKTPFIEFFDKYFGKKLPSAENLRQTYVDKIHLDEMEIMMTKILNKSLLYYRWNPGYA